MTKKRVVITGIGPYISNGKGKENLWETVTKNVGLARRIPEEFEKNALLKSKFYVPFPNVSFEETELHPKYKQIVDNSAQLAIICAKMALLDAGFELNESGDIPFFNKEISDAAVVLGIGICKLKSSFDTFAAHNFAHKPEILNDLQINSHFNRMAVPMLMPNSAAAWISILFGIHGPNYSLNTACSSGNYAIGEAYRKIKDGYVNIALAGGIENFEDTSGTIMRSFDALGTLTKSAEGMPIPFSKQRSGFLFAEGAACILVLEEYESALNRNAEIYAEISGFECNSDAKNIVLMDEKGGNIEALMLSLSANRKIDYINSHGTATMLNDEIESKVIKSVFGNKSQQPIINSSKGILGHTIGASAALEAAITALSIQKNRIHKNPSFDYIDDLNIAESTLDTDVNTALSMSYGFGGHNSALLLTKCN